ncbi:uncharacterized protein F5147DRAFT_578923 [Suillus discolor]|uniref:DDE-1 domain-containing protein n=1 Tax=Suillus discolor TaxID=1912936 RepID=A0A9P7F3V1_9AGAM|nr:uncharacterized protein F5147DRAFT_578923 [Suillus discolor]KAG2106628.1 hypothetical protein F5147DRAFT_578923 [Suillus discolor]
MQYVPNSLYFLSDLSSNEDNDSSNTNMDHSDNCDGTTGHISSALPRKRQKLDVPYHEQQKQKQAAKQAELEQAYKDITKHLKSKKFVFVGGPHGLQACRARTIEVHLMLVVKNEHGFKVASEMAAETNGFAAKWGGCQVRGWTREWMQMRTLPVSQWGWHAKISSLLDDPAIASELHTFMRSNKWSMDPQKLAKFIKNELLPTEATKYLERQRLVQNEMPQGLKRYIELELFPRIHMKVGCGVSLSTAHRWLPNNGQSMSWVPNSEHKLRKKGVGRGLHQSSIICSTVGHLEEAAHTIEYGKNYDGYWNGEMFVKQLRDKIIPAFECAHGSGYQALFLIDNSQGHSAYADDALLISRMNVNPGGKQAHMKDGWFIDAGRQKVIQSMMFPSNHCDHPNEPKGIKARYLCKNCDYTFETLKTNLPKAMASVCLSTIRLWEHRMHRWMDTYQSGLEMKKAQFQVKEFSSRKYKSHRCVPETVACLFD